MISRSPRTGALALAALVLLTAACGGGGASASPSSSTPRSTDPFGGRSATAIAALAAVNATRQHTISLRITSKMSGYRYESDTVGGNARGVGRITIGGAPMTIRLANDTAYVRGSAVALERMWRYPPATARRYAHLQLVERHAHTNWRFFVEPLDHGIWTAYDIELTGVEHRAGFRTINGQRTLGIRGNALNDRTPETVYVSTAAPHLPVEVVVGSGVQKQIALVTGWNQPVALPPAASTGVTA